MIASSTPPACRAPYALAQMRAVVGGNTWNGISGIVAYGQVRIAGLSGTGRVATDLADGRYARYFNVPAMGSSAEVYDGKTIWAQDISGGVHPYDTPFARERAITSAYLNRYAYLARANAKLLCIGTRVEDGRAVTVLRVQPAGGIAADLAIDSQTHLLNSVSVQLPLASDDGVTRYADYRTIDGLALPFSLSSGTPTAPTDGYAFDVTEYKLLWRASDADFAKPVVRNEARMIGPGTSTTVPMLLEGRQLIIHASINGRAPMPFILDTGGHAILTTEAAKSLGLHGRGAGVSGGSGSGTISAQYTRVRSLRIGNAELLDQPFLIIPYPYSFYERGKKAPLAGIIGLELFERFATRLDYGDRTVTFAAFPAFQHRKSGARVSLMFEDQEDMPVVEAAADGHAGLFGTDTGNAGILILFGDFLKRTGLLAEYTGGRKTIGVGTGGSNTGRAVTLRRFAIGGHTLYDVAGNFTQMTSGSFSSRTEAGNMGFSILSRFIPTFDYANQALYLDRETRATPFGVNRAGIRFEKNAPGAFDILLVDAGSAAAAAGLVPGDRIVAINGKDASNYSWADLVALVGKTPGTRLLLGVERAGAVRNVTLILR